MTSQLNSEDHRYKFNESSGQVIDDGVVGGLNSTSITGETYNGDSITLDGVTGKIVLPANVLDPTADFSGYLAFRNLDTVTLTKQMLAMDPNGFSPALAWLGVSSEHAIDVNNTGGDVVKISSRLITNTEILVYSYSYKVSTRLISLAVVSDENLNLFGTATESVTLPVNLSVQLGVDGTDSNFVNIELLQMGTYITTLSATDLTDTAVSLVKLLSADNTIIPNIIPNKIIVKNIIPRIFS